MLESRKDNYYGFEVTMYRIGDHLWISNIMPNAQYLVNQFNYDKMIWTQTTYTTDEIEELFNISSNVLKVNQTLSSMLGDTLFVPLFQIH